jgi:hypothetical protein
LATGIRAEWNRVLLRRVLSGDAMLNRAAAPAPAPGERFIDMPVACDPLGGRLIESLG